MKNYLHRCFVLILIMQLFLFAPAQKIGLIYPSAEGQPDKECVAGLEFLKDKKAVLISAGDINSPEDLKTYDVLWFHYLDSTFTLSNKRAINALKNYLNGGGKILLTLEAFRAINDLGIESKAVETRNKKAEDSGYGRKLGLHAFRSHPVFEGLNGGAYIFKPSNDTTVRITGFFDDHVPENGKVIAVDWDYIFLRENSKLMVEYNVGKGMILAVGGYTCLSQPNKNRAHLEKFLMNCFSYLEGNTNDVPIRYWSYGPQQVKKGEIRNDEQLLRVGSKEIILNNANMLSRQSRDQFWDVAGERLLVAGKENGGIEEIWAHPFMALKDIKTSLVISDSVIDLRKYPPEIEVRHGTFTRIYHVGNFILKEITGASKKEAIALIHYEIDGPESAKLLIEFHSNLRFMWPYSEKVLKKMYFGYDTNLNASFIHAENNEFNCLIGANKNPEKFMIGQFADFKYSFERKSNKNTLEITPEPTEAFEIGGYFLFDLTTSDCMDIVIAADHLDQEDCISAYSNALLNTSGIIDGFTSNDPAGEMLLIESPDQTFNEGYKWAVRATDRFFVHTPGLGSSLVAGYGTTKQGWDGGHKINGRPGYAWYFGRDGEWSGFALLDYGDFEKVRDVLAMYQKFQDLSGKIYHEVSTSGVVHYDASDATPLYIILAGKYLRHSGDIAFIDSSWMKIKKAIDFCFSTDTDGDHLIENTNVGHGWVEGGALFGSHSSLYLSSCWAKALGEAAYMARAIGDDQADFYLKESKVVRRIINEDFWNNETQFLSHGKLIDGSYFKEHSIMPAIPMYFNQVDGAKAESMLPVFASDQYTSDWGCRIISKSSKSFNPRGYHTGSVWPLYTGWISLAEYKNRRPVQGFTHIMNNLMVYKNWGLGFVEEVLHGEFYRPSGVCHHQCWSETMVLQPSIEGMLGFEPDALANSLKLSPSFPADWDSVTVSRIKFGSHTLDLKMNRSGHDLDFQFTHKGSQPVKLDFDPVFLPGTEVKEIIASGPFETVRLKNNIPIEIYIDSIAFIHYQIDGGIGVIPEIFDPLPGDSSAGVRIIDQKLEGDVLSIHLQVPADKINFFRVFIPDQKIVLIENGELWRRSGNVYTVKLPALPDVSDYTALEVKIHLESTNEK